MLAYLNPAVSLHTGNTCRSDRAGQSKSDSSQERGRHLVGSIRERNRRCRQQISRCDPGKIEIYRSKEKGHIVLFREHNVAFLTLPAARLMASLSASVQRGADQYMGSGARSGSRVEAVRTAVKVTPLTPSEVARSGMFCLGWLLRRSVVSKSVAVSQLPKAESPIGAADVYRNSV
jgi:hypothetical protein